MKERSPKSIHKNRHKINKAIRHSTTDLNILQKHIAEQRAEISKGFWCSKRTSFWTHNMSNRSLGSIDQMSRRTWSMISTFKTSFQREQKIAHRDPKLQNFIYLKNIIVKLSNMWSATINHQYGIHRRSRENPSPGYL